MLGPNFRVADHPEATSAKPVYGPLPLLWAARSVNECNGDFSPATGASSDLAAAGGLC